MTGEENARHGRVSEPATSVATKKMSCWVCGHDLIFNRVKMQSLAFVVYLYCKYERRARVAELRLHPDDVTALLGGESPRKSSGPRQS